MKQRLLTCALGLLYFFLARMFSGTQGIAIGYVACLTIFAVGTYLRPTTNHWLLTAIIIPIDLYSICTNPQLFPLIIPTEYLLCLAGSIVGKTIALQQHTAWKVGFVGGLLSAVLGLLYLTPHLVFNDGVQQEGLPKFPSTFTFVDVKQTAYTAQDLNDKLVFLDLWTTFCANCIRNFPNIKRLQAHYKEHPNIQILSVNCGISVDSFARFQTFMAQQAIEPTGFVYDQRASLADFLPIREEGVPQHVIVYQGKILWWHKGMQTDEQRVFNKKIIALLDQLQQRFF